MSLNISQEEIKSILKMINDIESKWGYSFANLNDGDEVMDELNAYLPDGYWLNSGASKCVIIPPHAPYVIKIPFLYNTDIAWNGDSYYWDSYAQTYRYRSDDDDYQVEFENAVYPISGGTGSDYCQSEAEYYQAAKEYGVADMLAETRFIGHAGGTAIYVQERCETYDDAALSHSEASEVAYDEAVEPMQQDSHMTYETRKERDYGWKFDRTFELRLVDSYSVKKLLKLFDFIEQEHLRDFHHGNIGTFAASGKPCIFDYSGYWD